MHDNDVNVLADSSEDAAMTDYSSTTTLEVDPFVGETAAEVSSLPSPSPTLTTASSKQRTMASASFGTIGLRIRELRITQDLAQKDLVEGAFSKAYISSVEAGRIQPSANALAVIASRLGVSSAYLLGQESSPNTTEIGQTELNATSITDNDDEELETESDWDMLASEIRITLRRNPELARNILIRKTRVRKLRLDILKQYYYVLGECYQASSDWQLAQDNFERCLDLASRSNDREMVVRSSNQLGSVYYTQGKIVQALEVHRGVVEAIARREITDPSFELGAFQHLADDFYTLGDYQQAFVYYQRAVEVPNI
jgi:transcriptional regulator with XRE-family HTH domain